MLFLLFLFIFIAPTVTWVSHCFEILKICGGFIKSFTLLKFKREGDGLTTFGQRITKAWENFKNIKPKENEEKKK